MSRGGTVGGGRGNGCPQKKKKRDLEDAKTNFTPIGPGRGYETPEDDSDDGALSSPQQRLAPPQIAASGPIIPGPRTQAQPDNERPRQSSSPPANLETSHRLHPQGRSPDTTQLSRHHGPASGDSRYRQGARGGPQHWRHRSRSPSRDDSTLSRRDRSETSDRTTEALTAARSQQAMSLDRRGNLEQLRLTAPDTSTAEEWTSGQQLDPANTAQVKFFFDHLSKVELTPSDMNPQSLKNSLWSRSPASGTVCKSLSQASTPRSTSRATESRSRRNVFETSV